ncbi:DUF6928 family protein [Nocardia asteroides]|uniref:DUF6928 family protein n=1 Tax=Nocardia asteroides TaxID=1824 RepID=UPI00030F62C2|nr:hypothetical protein [Nocardia asteroides]UGT47910.1 hypothetical protein LT345_26020 [Nocardia asteroides]SFM59140.1 hypothetical protein SAMN05444423_103501 [Nocardia asteroides]VEG33157.1 Uncharacterised protein [Nocardia asteroides]
MHSASTLWYVDTADPLSVLRGRPEPDAAAAAALAGQLYHEHDVRPIMVGTLNGCAAPDRDEVYIGCYPGLTVVCTAEAALVRPTKLPDLLVRPLASEHTYLVSFDSTLHWGAFAHWERGEFRRSFSSTRVDILENEGLPMVWERPFWAGERPVPWRSEDRPGPQSLPFDPPDFADAANGAWLGFRYRTPAVPDRLAPGDLAVCGFTLYPKGQAPQPQPQPVQAGSPGAATRRKRGLFGWLHRTDRVL